MPHADDSQTEPGQGATCSVEGQQVLPADPACISQHACSKQQANAHLCQLIAAGLCPARERHPACSATHGMQVAVGQLGFVCEQLRLPPEEASFSGTEEASTSGRTRIWVGAAGQGLVGSLEFEDALRPDAAAVVQGLQRQVRHACKT